MSKPRTFSGMAATAAKSVQNDRPQTQQESENLRCGTYGCRLRADIFLGGPGICLYHLKAQQAEKNPANVSDRIESNIDKIRTVYRYSRAPLALYDGVVRGTQAIEASHGGRNFEIVQLVYPQWLPIGERESHHDWLDRARAYLLNEIVGKAERSQFPRRAFA